MPAGEGSKNEAAPPKLPRSSIRQSLNFMSGGKRALQDMINSHEKGSSSHRSNTLNGKAQAPRPSLGDLPSRKRSTTPESGTLTHRRRMSAVAARPRQSVDEMGVRESGGEESSGTITRSATLRAKANGTGSALPKYRPKPSQLNPTKDASPLKPGVRRKHSISDDDKLSSEREEQANSKPPRPISPLPKRAVRHAPATSETKDVPPKPPPKRSNPSPTPKPSSSPSRSAKIQQSSSSSSSAKPSPRRPPSASSTNSSSFPDTPSKKPLAKEKARAPAQSSPLRKADTASRAVKPPSTSSGKSQRLAVPQTPPRGGKRSSAQLQVPVLVPMPDDSPRRRLNKESSNPPPRSSILSWEEVAQEASRTLGKDEVGNMLSELDAPFHSRADSPSLTYASLDLESPALSRFNSPAAFHSISAVLLPDMTPSPAPHINRSVQLDDVMTNSGDAAKATLLRLQLASVEQTAKDRLNRLQDLEVEMDELKKARHFEAEQLGAQVAALEMQVRSKLQTSMRADEENAVRISTLEERLKQSNAERRDEVAKVAAQTKREATAKQDKLKATVRAWQVLNASQGVASTWCSAKVMCQDQLSAVKMDRQVVEVLLQQLDLLHDKVTMEMARV